ncbi:hypothetical protein GALL_487810 [mine drainage metagenome]|uniref:Uncharacterized protein n=1 Tax=mine drainage metagenome TaxID=410659 RepID=A0A1J5PFR0_9ZZZZ
MRGGQCWLRHTPGGWELSTAVPAVDNSRSPIEIKRPLNPYTTGKFRLLYGLENTTSGRLSLRQFDLTQPQCKVAIFGAVGVADKPTLDQNSLTTLQRGSFQPQQNGA